MTEKARKFSVLSILFLFLAGGVAANDVTFSVSPVCGTVEGLVQEYVFYDNDKNGTYEYMVSRLDWQISQRTYYGGVTSLGLATDSGHQLTASTTLLTAVNGRSGCIEDRDWQMNITPYEYAPVYDGKLTDLSVHNNYITEDFFVSIQGDWVFPYGFGISIGGDLWKISFQSKGGYFQHGVANKDNYVREDDDREYWTAGMEKTYVSDTITPLVYTLNTNYLKTGIIYNSPASFPLQLNLGIWAIVLDAATGFDGHYSGGQPYDWYQDSMYTFLPGFMGKAAVIWNTSEHLSLQFKIGTTHVSPMQGITKSWKDGSTTKIKIGCGGVGYQTWDYSAGLTFVF